MFCGKPWMANNKFSLILRLHAYMRPILHPSGSIFDHMRPILDHIRLILDHMGSILDQRINRTM